MKTALLLLLLFACSSSEEKFIIISPEPGAMSMMSENGTIGTTKSTQVYFISMIQERDVKMKHGFVVLKLRRNHIKHFENGENKAYEILDNYNAAAKDDSDESWRLTRQVNDDFREHVKVNIEPEALITGISENGFLTYEP